MELLLKQRLIGAAVIVALAVIIIPMLLDGSGTETIQEIPLPPESEAPAGQGIVQQQPVPEPPPMGQPVVSEDTPVAESPSTPAPPTTAVETPPAAEPEPDAADIQSEEPSAPAAELSEPQGSEPEAAQPEATEPESALAKAEPEPTPSSAPEAWVIQVGSFGERDKAVALRQRLMESQYRAYVEQFSPTADRTMYRVRVGPLASRAEAEALNEKLLQVKGISDTYVTQHP